MPLPPPPPPAVAFAESVDVMNELGMRIPAGTSWGFLPPTAPPTVSAWYTDGTGKIEIRRSLVAGDRSDMVSSMLHELAHVASFTAATRAQPTGNPVEEGFAEATARDLVTVVMRRLEQPIPPPVIWGTYELQVRWARRVTTKACQKSVEGPERRRARILQCARKARWWFVTASDAQREQVLADLGAPRPPGVFYPSELLGVGDGDGVATTGTDNGSGGEPRGGSFGVSASDLAGTGPDAPPGVRTAR